MHLPSRARRILKWIGVGLSLLIGVTWMAGVKGQWSIPPARLELLNKAVFVGWSDTSRDYTYSLVSLAGKHLEHDRWVMWPRAEFRFAKVVLVPLWFLLFLTAIPTAWLWHRDRRRIRPGCCLRCGYDLTGNLSGVCSECGLAKPPPATV